MWVVWSFFLLSVGIRDGGVFHASMSCEGECMGREKSPRLYCMRAVAVAVCGEEKGGLGVGMGRLCDRVVMVG